jgi:hypothetical protein
MQIRHRTVLAVVAIVATGVVTTGVGHAADANGGRDSVGVRVTVVDQDGDPVRPAAVMACPVVAGTPDCDAPALAPTNRRGVARLRLDRHQTYEFSAFVQDPTPPWACPGFELDGRELYFSADRFTAKPGNVPRRATLIIEQPSPLDCATATVTDENGVPLPTAGMFVCPLAADGTPCPGPSFDGPDPDGVIRLNLDPTVTYRLQAFIVNTGWPCPAYTAPNGDTFHFSASVDLPATHVSGTNFVIDRPEHRDCP